MSSRAVTSLFLLAALLFFFALGNHQLQGSTEARVAGIAMEMHLDDDWVTPRLFGEPFLEKPPLSLWLDAGAMRVFGVSPWAVRLASAVAGLLSVMILYGMLRRFGRPKAIAWTAGILLATMASYWSNVRGVGEDALLALGVTTALLAFFQAQRASTPGNSLLFIIGIAIATLSKGVLGLAMPGVVIFAYLLADNLMDRRFKLTEWLRPGLLTALGLIPLLIWLVVLYQHGGAQAVREVLLTNSVGRFSGSFVEAGHYEPFYYYIAKLPEAFLPWNILVYLGLWHFRKQLKANRYLLFFSLWIVAQFILLTLASSKRTVYLMSMTPPRRDRGGVCGRIVRALERQRNRQWHYRTYRTSSSGVGCRGTDRGHRQLSRCRSVGTAESRQGTVVPAPDRAHPEPASRWSSGRAVPGQRTGRWCHRVLHPARAEGPGYRRAAA